MSTYRNSPYNNRNRQKRYRSTSDDWISILLYYIVPFVIVNGIIFFFVIARPKCTITVGETHDYLSTQVTLKVESWFPTKTISLSMDGEEIQLEKVKGRTYKATIYKNGALHVNVINLNGMSLTQFEHIDMLDDTQPEIEGFEVEDGIITIVFSDSQSGINFDSIYALDSVDTRHEPLTLDRSTATVTFEMDPAGLEVYAEDMVGNLVKATFSSHKEGEEEILEGGAISDSDEEGDAGLTEAQE